MSYYILKRVDHSLGDGSMEALWNQAATGGFDGLELDAPLSIGDREWLGHVSDRSEPAIHPAGKELADTAQRVLAVSTRCKSVEVEEAVKETESLLQCLQSSGACPTVLNLALPGLSYCGSTPGFDRYQDALNFAYDLLVRTRHTAEATDVAVAVEIGAQGVFLSPVEFRELLDRIHSPAIGVCLDEARLSITGFMLDWWQTLSHRIVCARIGHQKSSVPSGFLNQLSRVLRVSSCPPLISVDSQEWFDAFRVLRGGLVT